MARRYIARVHVLERHADGTSREFTMTRTVGPTDTIQSLFDWRQKRVHDPINGEYASREISISVDDSTEDDF